VVGRGVTVGHNVVLHGARIDDDVLVGMGSVVMNGVHIASGSIVAAGAVVTQGKSFPPRSVIGGVPATVIREATDATIWEHELPPPRPDLLREIEGCDGVLTLLTDRVDDEFLDRAGPQLKVVSNFAVGFDNVDVAACTARGVAVGNTPGVLTETTADLAWALLMAAARRLVEGDRYVRDGKWKTWGPMLLMGPDVSGATLGVIGFGRIGQAVARRAKGFGMRILYHDPRRASPAVEAEYGAEFRTLEGILPESDFVTLHVDLRPETRGLIDAERLGWMKKAAIVKNILLFTVRN